MSQNKIGRVGFMYRPKDRAQKLGFIMGLLNYQDPRKALDRCIDDVYDAYLRAVKNAKEQENVKTDDESSSNNSAK